MTDGTAGPTPVTADTDGDPLVSVRNLQKYFETEASLVDRLLGTEEPPVRAVDGVSFDVRAGETLGLVGESGCGKSTTGEALLHLVEPSDGAVVFDGRELGGDADVGDFRKRAQIVFQDPFASLDPRMTVREIVQEPLDVHGVGTGEERQERVASLIERVGLSTGQLERYPHEFSGGQRQRIGIARALALEPDFLVLDEPTSALDVSVQAQILNLLADLQDDLGLTYLFISHDLGVIRHICDRVAVMYLGEIVEIAPTDALFEDPAHPYTQALLESVPRADTAERHRDVDPLTGDVPSPRDPPSGCRFRTRCPKVIPPADVDLSQPQYRAVMDLRRLLATESLGIDQVRESMADDARGTDVDPTAVVEEVLDRTVEVDLPASHESTIRDALTDAVNGNRAAAEATLRDRYESVCETDHPTGDRATCHLISDDRPSRAGD